MGSRPVKHTMTQTNKCWTKLAFSFILACATTFWPGAAGASRSLQLEQKTRGHEQVRVSLLRDVLAGLERWTGFFSQDYSSINLDGLFGIRLAQGNIMEAARSCQQSTVSCPQIITDRLVNLYTTLGQLGDKALPYVQEQDPDYFDTFLPTIDGPYIIPYKPMSIAEYELSPGTINAYNEVRGDACLSSLMGTYQVYGRHVPLCTAREECWEMMTKPNQSKYSITHQLLFFIIGEKAGCLDKMNQKMSNQNLKSVKEIEKELCGHIYGEMLHEVKDGLDGYMQDLFLEQTLLCGTLGFQEFFPPSWISMVLSWQNHKGCFAWTEPLVEDPPQKVNWEQKKLLKLLEQEATVIDRSSPTGRKLLRESVMKDECLSHKSGLGVGVFGAYLRCLVINLFS